MKIRPIESHADIDKIPDIECKVWNAGYIEATPTHLLKSLINNGGLIIGAFDNNEVLLGFCYSFLTIDENGRIYHYMHSLAVLPAYQGKNIGYQILNAHKDISVKRGVKSISWTFDPLESLNANLYMRKIGAVVDKPYQENYYGKNRPGINENLPCDRLIASLYLNSYKKSSEDKKQKRYSLEILMMEYYVIEINTKIEISDDLMTIRQPVAFEIPMDFQKIKETNKIAAIDIRMNSRRILKKLLDFMKITDFISIVENKNRRNFYILEPSLFR